MLSTARIIYRRVRWNSKCGAYMYVEWQGLGRIDVLGHKPDPVSLCPPQITNSLAWDWTRACAVTGRKLNAYATARTSTAYHIKNMWQDGPCSTRTAFRREYLKEMDHSENQSQMGDSKNSRFSAVFLNRRAAARYRALASIIPGRERCCWNSSF